jgi:hypothetical protein
VYPGISPSWIKPLALRAALFLCLLSILGVTAPSGALAASPSDEGCNQDDDCRAHFVKGKALYKQQDYTAALKEFQDAYERRQTPILLANIGRTLQKLGRPKEALEYYERCQAAAKSDQELQQKLAEYIAETKALLPTASPAVAATPKSELEPQPAPSVSVEEPKPVYKRGWFIAVVVVGAVAVAGAVTAGVIVGTRPSLDPALDPNVTVLRPFSLSF